MGIDLFGNYFETVDEYACRLMAIHEKEPVYKVFGEMNTDGGITMEFHLRFSEDRLDRYPQSIAERPGIYTIYKGVPGEEDSICIYAGYSTNTMRGRIYRFFKELNNLSRPDEGFPAAKKARKENDLNPNNIHCKLVFIDQHPPKNEIDMKKVGEHVVHLINPRYNDNGKAY